MNASLLNVSHRNNNITLNNNIYYNYDYLFMCNSVDLPEPDVPMMVTNSPSPIENDTPRSACTVSSPTWKFRFMF